MNKQIKFIATSLALLFSWARPDASADTVFREVELTTAAEQIIVGGFGSGVFWRPSFDLEPFTINVGDIIDVTVRLDRSVVVIAGAVELEAVGAFATAPNLHLGFNSIVNWDFLNVKGSLFSDHISATDSGEGSGIGGQSVLDLTDTSFSFKGMHFSIAVTAGTGFPANLTQGAMAIQTQGIILFGTIPEPRSLSIAVISILTLYPRRQREVSGTSGT